ncbi:MULTISPECIES: hypothetical protein [unclassified Alteromonas]|uniref:hypothetical protein n=1 Tax=unclassified Alteromonas TaxID=2614992 RepID=UPI00068FE4BB|nr:MULTISPECIES: hypothetical protein [unclassified Alteromonas]
MNMTLKEKSTWLSLIATLVIFGSYTLNVINIDLASVSEQQAIDIAMGNLSQAILYIIIVEIIFQSLIAVAGSKADIEGDERDRFIALTANNSGYWVLSIGVVMTLGQLLLPHALGVESSIKSYFPIPLFEVHVLLLMFILSEIVRFTHQIILYRKDAV